MIPMPIMKILVNLKILNIFSNKKKSFWLCLKGKMLLLLLRNRVRLKRAKKDKKIRRARSKKNRIRKKRQMEIKSHREQNSLVCLQSEEVTIKV